MARKRRTTKGSLLPFAAGLVVGYLVFNRKQGAQTTTTSTVPDVMSPQPGTILTIPGKGPRIKISGFTLHSGGVLRPEYHNLYL